MYQSTDQRLAGYSDEQESAAVDRLMADIARTMRPPGHYRVTINGQGDGRLVRGSTALFAAEMEVVDGSTVRVQNIATGEEHTFSDLTGLVQQVCRGFFAHDLPSRRGVGA